MKFQQSGRSQSVNAMRYVDQLTRHWGHRFDVRQRADGAWLVDFGDESAVILASRNDEIEFTVIGEEADLAMLRQVTEEHVDRFAHREGKLAYHWDKPLGSEPTSQDA